jgi:hypothetical protein
MSDRPDEDTLKQMCAEIKKDFEKRTSPKRIDREDPASLALAFQPDEIDRIIEQADDDSIEIDARLFNLREIYQRDIDNLIQGKDLQVIPAITYLLRHLLNKNEMSAIDGVYLKYVGDPKDQSIKKQIVKEIWDNLLANVQTVQDIRDNVYKHYRVTFEYTIEGLPGKSQSNEYRIHEKGITKRTIYFGKEEDVITDTEIWIWKDFKILNVLKDASETQTIYRYNYIFNGDIFLDKTLVEMRDFIYDGHCKSTGKDKQIFGPLIHHYVNAANIQVMEYSPECGFTRHGWRMPDKYYIKFSDLQSKIKRGLDAMLNMKVIDDEAKFLMRELYESVSLKYKDVIFAYGAIAPFLYALRDYTDLMPWMSLYSIIGGTGKTPAGVMITQKIWFNLPRPFLTKDQVSSEARFGDFISATTLPVLIDDCGDLPEKINNTIKDYITGEAGFTRLNANRSVGIDKNYSSPIIMSFNTPNDLYNDVAFLSRGFNVPVNNTPSTEEVARFKESWHNLERGYIGKYIYEQTKHEPYEYFINLFEHFDGWEDAPNPRANTIYKLIQMGKYLYNKWFGIELDVEAIKELVLKTLEMGSEDIFTIIQIQILLSVHENDEPVFPNQAKRDWIKEKIIFHDGRDFTGYCYNASNLQDLKDRLNMRQRFTLENLAEVLRKKWDEVEMRQVRLSGSRMRCLFIPAHVINFNQDDDEDEQFDSKFQKIDIRDEKDL